MYDLIVIGAGPGEYEAAGHAGRMGKKVALIERGKNGRYLPVRGLHSGQDVSAVLEALP